MYIYPLPRIHNKSLVSTYFGQDKRECVSKIFIYLFIITQKYVKVSLKEINLICLTFREYFGLNCIFVKVR
jgi:hypothetical protein